MNPDPTLTRAADETAGQQPSGAGRSGEAASARGGSREPQPVCGKEGFYTFDEMVPPSAAARGDTREARRTRRMNDLEIGRMLALQAIARLNDGVAGKLFGDAQAIVEKLNDPYLAMSRLYQELRRIVALEEQLDEDAEERAKRLAAEAVAREKAARDAALRQTEAAAAQAEKDTKRAVRRAVGFAYRDGFPETTQPDRENLLDDLFDDYDEYQGYGDDPVAVVARMCAELGLTPEAGPDADPAVTEQARALEFARGYLERAGMAFAPVHGPPDG